jgi:large subunit ribosomal protein L9
MRKLLLKADVKSLGKIGDIVKVSEGYARNYLVPQGLATEPTPKNIERVEEERKKIEARRAQELAEKRALAERLNGVEVTLVVTCNEQGVLFGSVGPKEIADALREEGYNIDPRNVQLADHLKQVEKYSVPLELAPEVTCSVTVWVTPSKDTPVTAPINATETQPENIDTDASDGPDE